MANLNIAIKIGADDKASGPIGKIGAALRGLTSSTGVAGRGFSGLQTIMNGMLLGGATLAIGALGLLGGAAVSMADEVQTATAGVQAALGLGAEEAKSYGDVIKNVYGANFGDSVTAVGDAVKEVGQQFARLGETSSAVIEQATVNALRLRDAYGIEVAESTATATALMNDFGLSQQEAFDFIATGMQKGLNASDDFLDSIGEYSVQFASLGFDAGNFFSILETGQQAGVLGTDKMADAIKEWGIIMTEGGERASGALGALGLDYASMQEGVSSGGREWADYFNEIVGGLNSIEDPVQRQRLAVQLFGTMAEDMGAGFLDGLDMMATGLSDMQGATESLDAQYATLGDALEGFKRQALVALEPLGGALLILANFVLPYVRQGLNAITPVLEAIGTVVQRFTANLTEGMSPIDAFRSALQGVVSDEMIGKFDEFIGQVQSFIGQVRTTAAPVLAWVTNNTQLNDVLGALGIVLLSVVVPALLGVVAAAAPVLLVFGALVAGIALARTAWEENWGGIQEKTGAAMVYVQGIIADGLAFIQGWWGTHGDEVIGRVQEIWDWLKTAFFEGTETAKVFISDGLTFIQDWWGTHGEEVIGRVQSMWEWIKDKFDRDVATIRGFVSSTLAIITRLWATHGNRVKSYVAILWNFVKATWNNATTIVKGVQAAFQAVVEGNWFEFGVALREIVDGLWAQLVAAWETGKDLIITTTSTAVEDIKAKFTDIDWWEVGSFIIYQIGGGISGATSALAEAAVAAAQSAWEAAMGFFSGAGGSATQGAGASGGSSSNSGGGSFGSAGSSGSGGSSGGVALARARSSLQADARGGTTSAPQYVIHVDARGSVATAEEIRSAVQQALREVGVLADQRIRSGI